MLVLPRPRVQEFLAQPGTTGLLVTDSGFFPRADSHGRRRSTPISQGVVIACVDGVGWCETESGRFPVQKGQVMVLPPGSPHSYGADGLHPWTLWWFHVAGPAVDRFFAASGLTPENPVRRPRDLYPVVALMSEVLTWMERDSTTTSLNAAAGAAWHALTLLASDRSRETDSKDVIEHTTEYLRNHLADHVSIRELASLASLSPSRFSALFKRQIGYSVVQYHTLLRMARARELLDTTSRPVATIAAEVGYVDSFYFARQFKKVHGMTARQYRAQRKG